MKAVIVWHNHGTGWKTLSQHSEGAPRSVTVAKATCYPFGWAFYNWFCCCASEFCGSRFCCPKFLCLSPGHCSITMKRASWLWRLHFVCFVIHTLCAAECYRAGMGSEMQVEILRVKPAWQNRGGGYSHEIVPANVQFVHIHIVAALFFGFSAAMHGVWVVFAYRSASVLWKHLDQALCWWCADAWALTLV